MHFFLEIFGRVVVRLGESDTSTRSEGAATIDIGIISQIAEEDDANVDDSLAVLLLAEKVQFSGMLSKHFKVE